MTPRAIGTEPRRRLFIDVQHGLCNRLRAMASAKVIADATNRDLVVVWRRDDHCRARLSDLLHYPGLVIEDKAADLARQMSGKEYNYMEIEPDSCFEAPILADPDLYSGQDVYVRSAYTLVSPHANHAAEQRFLRSLVPIKAVRDLIARVPHPNDVAIHIRSATGDGFEHLPYEKAEGNWPEHRHQELLEWRAKSTPDRFLARLEQLIAGGRANNVFLAADQPQTYATFHERFGDRVTWLARDVNDRSDRQLQFALADLILLTSAKIMLASTWSSFSDLAHRLARPGRPLQRSGRDF